SFERSGSYKSSSEPCVNTSDLPFDIGWSGLPSTLIGRNASDFTRTGIAPVGNGNADAKYIGLPSTKSSGCFTYGKIGSSGCFVQPASQARDSDAPIHFRKPRRLTEISHSLYPD